MPASHPYALCVLIFLAQSVWGKEECLVTSEGKEDCETTRKESHVHDENLAAYDLSLLQQKLRLQGSLDGDSNVSAQSEDFALLQLHAAVAHPSPQRGGDLNPLRPDPEEEPMQPKGQVGKAAAWVHRPGASGRPRHLAKRASRSSSSLWCGYEVQKGFITALTMPNTENFMLDITDELEREGAVRFMVTAMATTGTYADQFGYLTQYAYPQEDVLSTFFELREGPTPETVDVYYPALEIRTSDNQTERAVARGVGSGWHDSLNTLFCSGGHGGHGGSWMQRGPSNPPHLPGMHSEPEGVGGLEDATSLLETQPKRNSSEVSQPDVRRRVPVVLDGGYLLQQGFYATNMVQGAVSYRLLSVKAFPNNFDVTAEFSMSDGFPFQVGFSLVRLRKEPMVARAADDRLLYFSQDYQDLGWHNPKRDELPNEATDRSVTSIWRYNFDALPDNQIKIYVDPTVPERWRPAFRAGIELWNDAFALVGRPKAVKAVMPGDSDWPEDYNVADARFNTISWVISNQVVSMGIAKVDPRSGEILKSDIMMSDGWVRSWLGDLDLITPGLTHRFDLNGGWRSESLIDASDHRAHTGRAGLLELHQELQREISSNEGRTQSSGEWGKKVSLLSTAGGKPLSETELQNIMSQGLKSIVAHETGHILGLRHNFKGSMGISYECTRNISCTAIHGLSTSVMDYLPMNAPSLGSESRELHIFTPVLGAYDKLAIQYGYMNATDPGPGRALTLAPEVRTIVEQAEAYDTCYDTDRGKEDPACAAYDLSSEPLRYLEEELDRLALIQRHLLNASVRPGASYTKYGESVLDVLSLALSHGLDAAVWLGGVTNHYANRHPSAPERAVARVAVPASTQRKAAELVLRVMRPGEAGLLPPKQALAFLVQRSRGQDSVETLDIESKVRTIGSRLSETLLGCPMLTRMHDLEHMAPADAAEPPLGVGEYLELVVTGVFGRQGTINASQSEWDLQTMFLTNLTALYKTDATSTLPEEVLSHVLGQLRRIHSSSEASLLEAGSGSHGRQREHLLSLRRRVASAVCGESEVCEALQSSTAPDAPTTYSAAAAPFGVLVAIATLVVGAVAASAA